MKEEEFLKAAGSQAAKSAYRGTTNKNDDGAVANVIVALFAMCLFSGYCVCQLIFRGKRGVNHVFYTQTFTIIGFVAFLGLAFYCYGLGISENANYYGDYGTKSDFALASFIFLIVSLGSLFIGLNEIKQTKKNIHYPDFAGSFTLFAFLIKQGYSPSLVGLVIEPLVVIIIGLLGFAIAPVIGIPIMISGVSHALGTLVFDKSGKQKNDSKESYTIVE
jgi:hypothetical protein